VKNDNLTDYCFVLFLKNYSFGKSSSVMKTLAGILLLIVTFVLCHKEV